MLVVHRVSCGPRESVEGERESSSAHGKTIADVFRAVVVIHPTCHCWKQQYGGIQAEETI